MPLAIDTLTGSARVRFVEEPLEYAVEARYDPTVVPDDASRTSILSRQSWSLDLAENVTSVTMKS
jgi:hypothetical protein